MATRKTAAKPKTETQISVQPEEVTLEEALKEEGEGRKPDNLDTVEKKTGVPSKAEQAMKIMGEMWDDIQCGTVKRKDVIKRFVDEVHLIKAGASTYYDNCKQKIMKDA